MKVLIVHNPATDLDSVDDADVLVQVQAVEEALLSLGHQCAVLAWPEDPRSAGEILGAGTWDLVFNLVESIQGSASAVYLVPAMLEELGLAFTGASSWPMRHSTSKLLAKTVLTEHDLPTPAWLDLQGRGKAQTPGQFPGRFIVKSVWEHASFGLDEDNVVQVSNQAELLMEMKARGERLGGEFFAEEYVSGREFNLAVLERDGLPWVLAPAEILFAGYAKDKRRVVGFRAKWQEQSFEYQNTKRRLDFPESDAPLLRAITLMVEQCWKAFALSGYARIDLRVDAKGRPWIIDVNANPCLSPNAGFQASCAASGLSFPEVVSLLLRSAALRNTASAHHQSAESAELDAS